MMNIKLHAKWMMMASPIAKPAAAAALGSRLKGRRKYEATAITMRKAMRMIARSTRDLLNAAPDDESARKTTYPRRFYK